MSLTLHVLSLRYSSWSIRALITLWHAGADVDVHTAEPTLSHQGKGGSVLDDDAYVRDASAELVRRRALGSVNGNFPVLDVNGTPIHEALAICEWAAERYPSAGLWPDGELERARARALASEMSSGFPNLRTHLSSHPLARVTHFTPDGPTRVEIARVHEVWRESLDASGGPFLFGRFGIVDAMYFPVLMRFETYGVPIPEHFTDYARSLHALPAIQRWRALATQAPRIPVYDDYILSLGGTP